MVIGKKNCLYWDAFDAAEQHELDTMHITIDMLNDKGSVVGWRCKHCDWTVKFCENSSDLMGNNCVVIGDNAIAASDDCLVIGDEAIAVLDEQFIVGEYLFDEPIPDKVREMVVNYGPELHWLLQIVCRRMLELS